MGIEFTQTVKHNGRCDSEPTSIIPNGRFLPLMASRGQKDWIVQTFDTLIRQCGRFRCGVPKNKCYCRNQKPSALKPALGRPTLRVQRYRCRSRVSLFNYYYRSILCVAWLLSTLCQVSLCPLSCFRPLMMFRPLLYRLWQLYSSISTVPSGRHLCNTVMCIRLILDSNKPKRKSLLFHNDSFIFSNNENKNNLQLSLKQYLLVVYHFL